jgi:uncharacterized ion transporter superfamily protein YfcC
MIKNFKVPHTLVLLYGMIVVAYLLTLMLPAGAFDTVVNDHGRGVVIPDTFTVLPDADKLPVWSLFTVIPRGLAAAQGIIFFVFIIGGALAVIRSTGALDAALAGLLKRFDHRPALLIFMGMFGFAAGSSTIGMAEEYIPLVAILITLCVGMRMDTVAAVAPVSGYGFRLAMFFPFLAIGFVHVWRYARAVRTDHSASLVADIAEAQPPQPSAPEAVTRRHQAVLFATLGALALVVWGISQYGWYLVELGAVFVALAVVVGLIGRMSFDNMARTFTLGAAELTGTALLIGFARAIELMLSDGQVLHTIVNALATPLTLVGGELSAIGMLLIQSMLNFFIPSGSGQAYVTMPLMAPIADIVGVTRQVAVLAYQMGDGFMNMVVPTNPVLMGILGICGIPYGRWLRFIWPLIAQLLIAGSIAIVIAVRMGYS